MLKVQNKNNILVIDSRLVAEELGIQHTTFKDTISKYTEKLESLAINDIEPLQDRSSYRLIKETAPRNENGSGGVTYYLLNEDQTVFLTTLSQNTPKVVDAKFNLVQAFSKAKKMLTANSSEINNTLVNLTTIVLQQQEQLNKLANRTLQLDNVLAEKTELNNKLNKIKDAGSSHKGCYNILQAEIEKEDTRLFTAFDYLQDIQKPTCNAKLVARRAATLFRCDRKAEPFKNKQNQLLFEKKYLDEAVTSIADLLIEE